MLPLINFGGKALSLGESSATREFPFTLRANVTSFPKSRRNPPTEVDIPSSVDWHEKVPLSQPPSTAAYSDVSFPSDGGFPVFRPCVLQNSLSLKPSISLMVLRETRQRRRKGGREGIHPGSGVRKTWVLVPPPQLHAKPPSNPGTSLRLSFPISKREAVLGGSKIPGRPGGSGG